MSPPDAEGVDPYQRSLDPRRLAPEERSLGGERYGRLIRVLRHLLDGVSGGLPPEAEVPGLIRDIGAIADRFAAWQVPERAAPAGVRLDLPGRGHLLLPPLALHEWSDQLVVADITFSRFYLGGGGAAHGGSVALLFDEVLGRLANSGTRPLARTASITVNYRQITRIGVTHRLRAEVGRSEGRKRWVSGSLTGPEGTVVADAEGLFVELRPGQP